jgi:riboflavin synthase
MFTGLIETTGVLQEIRHAGKSMLLGIAPKTAPFDVAIGESVSIDGACLTLESCSGNRFYFMAVPETVGRTTLASARVGDIVNLERALSASGRFDGHMVLGHIDGVGTIISDRQDDTGLIRSIALPESLLPLAAEKGSIAVDGMSLTIARIHGDVIEISFIPHTLKTTTMGRKTAGDRVNIECDVLARYIARMISFPSQRTENGAHATPRSSRALLDALERSGF